MDELLALEEALSHLGRVVVGFSGGVDSTLLATAAHRVLGDRGMVAVLGMSPAVPTDQLNQAVEIARRIGFPLRLIRTEELADPRYVANATDRCFHCKTELWRQLHRVRDELEFDTILDGTHRGDLHGHRPGYGAGHAAGVRSPFVELGWDKTAVRAVSEALALPNWDAPAGPCLASRIQYGLAVTPERLRQVELAEAYLRGVVGVQGDLRVRHLGAVARIEVNPNQFPRLEAAWEAITDRLLLVGFAGVERDPDGYRSGALLPILETA